MAVTESQARTAMSEVWDAYRARNPQALIAESMTRATRLVNAELGGRHWRRVSPAEAVAAATAVRSRLAQQRTAPGQQVLSEAVRTAVDQVLAARKTAKKAAKRAAQETADQAAVQRMAAGRLRAARMFSETSIGPALRKESNADLALITAAAMGSRPAPGARPVVEMTVDPAALSLGDLGVAAVAGSAGGSPFWTGQTSGASPFWRMN